MKKIFKILIILDFLCILANIYLLITDFYISSIIAIIFCLIHIFFILKFYKNHK